VVRHPFDVAVSYAHHLGMDLTRAIELMAGRDGVVVANPERRLPFQLHEHIGSWSEHVESWRDNGEYRVSLARFEDLFGDPLTGFRRLTAEAGLPATDDRISAAVRAATFARLQSEERSQGFRERPRTATAFLFAPEDLVPGARNSPRKCVRVSVTITEASCAEWDTSPTDPLFLFRAKVRSGERASARIMCVVRDATESPLCGLEHLRTALLKREFRSTFDLTSPLRGGRNRGTRFRMGSVRCAITPTEKREVRFSTSRRGEVRRILDWHTGCTGRIRASTGTTRLCSTRSGSQCEMSIELLDQCPY